MKIDKMCVIHMLICFFFKKLLESGILEYGMSTVWEGTDGCSKQYRCDLAIYLMNVLSSSCGIILDRAMNAPVHGKNIVDGLYATDKLYLK